MFLRSPEPVGTYYAGANPELIQPRDALREPLECEVLVIGAGFSGLHTALQLKHRSACIASKPAPTGVSRCCYPTGWPIGRPVCFSDTSPRQS